MTNQIILNLLVCVLSFILCACQMRTMDVTNTTNETSDLIGTQQEFIANRNNIPNEISIASVKGISEEQVSILCREVIGEKDDGTGSIYEGFDTGFELSYLCDGAIECRGVQYYVVRMSWLVDNNHWSYIGDLIVSANGYEIYSGLRHSDGSYSFGEMLWSSPLNDSNKAIKVPLVSVKGISEEDALDLCCTKLGEKDETTGFALEYHCVTAVKLNEQSYYAVSRSYIYEGERSDMGIVMVSSNGDIIYDGVVDKTEDYYFGRVLWNMKDTNSR